MNDLDEKIKAILGNRQFIKLRTLKKIDKKYAIGFVEKAEEFGYYKCDECGYYIRKDKYDHNTNLCYSCLDKALETAEQIKRLEKGEEKEYEER